MVTLVAVVTSVTPPSGSDGWGLSWARVRAPAVAGISCLSVSIGTLPMRVPAAQPGSLACRRRPRSPMACGGRLVLSGLHADVASVRDGRTSMAALAFDRMGSGPPLLLL